MELLKEQVDKALAALAALGRVFVPAAADGVTRFAAYAPGLTCDLGIINTDMPPKQVLFPQMEGIYRFTMGPDSSVEEIVCGERQILFGIRPCDMRAIDCLDKVFGTDSSYNRRRENLTLVAATCCEAGPACFCGSMGIDPGNAPGADLLLNPTTQGWNIHCQSEKGELALAAIANLCRDGAGEELPPARARLRADASAAAEKLPALFGHHLWDTLALPCLGCGACAFLCPTCHCFALAPERRGQAGVENRYWDSCMFAEYTAMADGHNPRSGLKERLRNRYLHKLVYFAQQYGQSLCVGCGRCVAKCPAGLDIGAFIEMIAEVETP